MNVETILASVITAGFAFLGVYMSNRKQAALVAYRLEKLEEKVDKHNNVVERMYRLEEQVKNLQAEMSELRKGEPLTTACGRSIVRAEVN